MTRLRIGSKWFVIECPFLSKRWSATRSIAGNPAMISADPCVLHGGASRRSSSRSAGAVSTGHRSARSGIALQLPGRRKRERARKRDDPQGRSVVGARTCAIRGRSLPSPQPLDQCDVSCYVAAQVLRGYRLLAIRSAQERPEERGRRHLRVTCMNSHCFETACWIERTRHIRLLPVPMASSPLRPAVPGNRVCSA